MRKREIFTTIRTEGAILPVDLLQRIAGGDKNLGGLSPDDYHLQKGEKLNEAINRSWNRLLGAWESFSAAREKLPASDTGTSLTRERWLLVLFQELGYGRLPASRAVEVDGKSYPISHFWHLTPIHLVGCGIDLDRRTSGVAGASRTSPHGLVQEFLNRSREHLWGIVSNGLNLRVLRDNASLTRQAYVEFDLEGMMKGEVYADFALLWLLCHQSRVEAERIELCWLEKWSRAAQEQGTRVLEQLRDGVENAITALGRGFLDPANCALREKLRSGQLSAHDYYRQLLRLVYRVLFLFVAEDRDLLLNTNADPAARERYTLYYSTARLRRLAEKRRGTRHWDLYESLQLIMEKLGSDQGCPELGLPALGSFLFSDRAIPDLMRCRIVNRDLLEAVRALAVTSEGNSLRLVDYKNLGSEELGSVYESLLELHPEVNIDVGTFTLATSSGHERKTTGSYYTPTSLITCLLDSALDPVVEEALKKENREQALLNLKVCDPACGSGHFLIAAAHRIAKRLAAVRTGDEEPSPEATRKALRDVIGRCIYGVDVNEMAVELCKVALWMEALEPGKPLSFLDHRILCGNSLLGTTPKLMADGIPDAAFAPIEGDEKSFASALKKLNKTERNQLSLPLAAEDEVSYGSFADRVTYLDSVDDDSISGVHEKEESYTRLSASEEYRRVRLLADAWCAAFVWKKRKEAPQAVTQDIFRRLQRSRPEVPAQTISEIQRLTAQYNFFHWHLAFPDVFRIPPEGQTPENQQTIWSGGFDVVLGNPPWEKFTISDEEWFASRDPQIAETKGKASRDKLIGGLAIKNPELFRSYLQAKRDQEVYASVFSVSAGTYPLTGFRELNTYHLFAELADRITAPSGRTGIIVKTGIGSAENCLPFFKALTEQRQLISLYDFVNKKALFPSVQTVERFSLLTFTGRKGHTNRAHFATLCQVVEDLNSPGRRYELSADDIALMSPINGACPLLRGERDAEIMRRIYKSFPVLGRSNLDTPDEFWNIEYTTIFHMANDSEHFKRLEDLQEMGLSFEPDRRARSDQDEYWPLYEGKYLFLLDHRYGSFETVPILKKYGRKATAPSPIEAQHRDPNYEILPRYWFPKSLWLERAAQRGLRTDFQFLFRDVAGVYPDLRTAIGAICPAGPAGHKAPVLTLVPAESTSTDALRLLGLAALFCSIPFDYLVRNKLFSKSFNLNTLAQIPMPPPSLVVPEPGESHTHRVAFAAAALELSYTSNSLRSLGESLGVPRPFIWDADRRVLLLREIDALAAHFYGLSREEFAYVLSTFETLRDFDMRTYGQYRTAVIALEVFERVHQSRRHGRPYVSLLEPPPPDPQVVHPTEVE